MITAQILHSQRRAHGHGHIKRKQCLLQENSGCSMNADYVLQTSTFLDVVLQAKSFKNSKKRPCIISLPSLKLNLGNQKSHWLHVIAATWNGFQLFLGTNWSIFRLTMVGNYLKSHWFYSDQLHLESPVLVSIYQIPQSLICWLEQHCLSSLYILPS